MERDPLRVVRDVRLSLTGWLDSVRTMPDPSDQPPGTVQKIAGLIRLVDTALRDAPAALAASAEWKRETAAYTEILLELRARLYNFEITLRIRHNQMRGARANLRVARCWSDLAKHIG
jgi:hypothetical protein